MNRRSLTRTIFFLSGYLITTLLMDERVQSGRIHIGKVYLHYIRHFFGGFRLRSAIKNRIGDGTASLEGLSGSPG
jgi:hypothetical protein